MRVEVEAGSPESVDGTILGSYDPGGWKSDEETPRLERLAIISADSEVAAAAGRAAVVANWTNRARELANAPPNELTPERLAQRAAEVANTSPELSAEALGLEEIRELGMGALAGVAQGSHNPAQVIVMRYEPAEPRTEVVLGLVGKAVTFDTGGMSVKKAPFMGGMKGEKAGGGAGLP